MQFKEVQSEQSSETKSYKYWVASSNFFETSLVFYPVYNNRLLKQENLTQLSASAEIFDCDGKSVNKIQCSFDNNKVSVLEMASLLEGLKYEAGIKHGFVELKTSSNLSVQCRINSHSSAAVLGDLDEISRYQKAFLPLRLGESTNTLIVLANLSKDINSVKVKLFLGKRTPEVNVELAAGSVRLLSLADEFAECIENKSFAALGYLRVASKNDLPFALQIIESTEGLKEEAVFSSIL